VIPDSAPGVQQKPRHRGASFGKANPLEAELLWLRGEEEEKKPSAYSPFAGRWYLHGRASCVRDVCEIAIRGGVVRASRGDWFGGRDPI